MPIVAASGFAGLGYEIVWTRMFASGLGTEMMAVLGVVTGFFAGLALGALVLDGPIRRVRSARRAYALLEAVIAIWAVASIWLIPAAGRVLPPLLGATPAPALLWAAGFALPALVLLPATVAMGGTLIALERLSASARGQARVAAGVYGANTAGAVAGAMTSVLVLLPSLGLSGTLFMFAVVNFACALAALALGPAADRTPPKNVLRPGQPGTAWLGITLWATGLLGIAFEVLVVRLAAQVLQNTIFTFAFLLAAYLLGTAAGGLLWQRSRAASGRRTLNRLLTATALACLATAGMVQWLGPLVTEAGPRAGPWAELAVACALFLLPTTAMGAVFGCLAQAVRDRRGTLGWAVGINSLGAALAPPLAALALIPAVGAWTALLPVALGYAVLGLGSGPGAFAFAAPGIAAVLLWLAPTPSLTRLPPGGVLVEQREGASATAGVVEGADGTRYLEVNGHFRMGGTQSIRSDWRQAHVPLLLHPDPRRALFLGVGTGATIAGAAALPRVAATGVELTPEVIGLLPWFAEQGAPPLPLIVVADARRFVAAGSGLYDVIVADLFHPALDGTGSLYTVEHFRAVRDRLADGGLFCQWLPLYQLDRPSLAAIIRAFLDVYPTGSAWLAHFSLQTPMLALCGSQAAIMPDPAVLTVRMNDPAARAALRRTGLTTPMDLLGLYAGGSRSLAAYAGPGPRNTDDFPVVTLDAQRNVRALAAPPADLLLAVLHGLTSPMGPDATQFAERLRAYWRARDRFIEAGAALPAGRALMDAAIPGLLEAVRLSAEFEPAYGPLMQMARSLIATDRTAGRALLQAIDAAAPTRGDARSLLARIPPP